MLLLLSAVMRVGARDCQESRACSCLAQPSQAAGASSRLGAATPQLGAVASSSLGVHIWQTAQAPTNHLTTAAALQASLRVFLEAEVGPRANVSGWSQFSAHLRATNISSPPRELGDTGSGAPPVSISWHFEPIWRRNVRFHRTVRAARSCAPALARCLCAGSARSITLRVRMRVGSSTVPQLPPCCRQSSHSRMHAAHHPYWHTRSRILRRHLPRHRPPTPSSFAGDPGPPRNQTSARQLNKRAPHAASVPACPRCRSCLAILETRKMAASSTGTIKRDVQPDEYAESEDADAMHGRRGARAGASGHRPQRWRRAVWQARSCPVLTALGQQCHHARLWSHAPRSGALCWPQQHVGLAMAASNTSRA